MTDDITPIAEVSVEERYGEQLRQVDAHVARGDYKAGIALLQDLARTTGDVELARRLVRLRVDASVLAPADIDPAPMYEANELLDDVSALRARLHQDGYLFFRSIVPVDALLSLRDKITQILAEQRWIADGEDRMAARAIHRPLREGQPKFFAAHDRIMKLEALHSLSHNEQLMRVMRAALGDSVFPHPLSIIRLVFPDAYELSTPPHQDYPNNQGTPNLTAAWIPLGDCRMADGSLAVLEGSNKFGVLPLDFHLGAGNRQAVLNEKVLSCRWVGADFKAGDIVLFPALTVHRALDNKNLENMRLSVDFRYQLEGEALTPICLQPHFERLTWDEIYAGWESTRYQYYWRDKEFAEVPWDPSLHELPEDDLFEACIQIMEFNVAVTERREARGAADAPD